MSKRRAKAKPKKKAAKKKVKSKPPPSKQSEEARRADYEVMDDLIEDTLTVLWGIKNKFPSLAAIAKKIGCDVSTVKRHIADESIQDRLRKYRVATPFVIRNILKQASTGKDAAFAKLWLEKIEGLSDKKVMDVTSGGKELRQLTITRKIIGSKS